MGPRPFDRFFLHAVAAVIIALVLYGVAALWIAAHAAATTVERTETPATLAVAPGASFGPVLPADVRAAGLTTEMSKSVRAPKAIAHRTAAADDNRETVAAAVNQLPIALAA